jgi:hypothetical protein
MNVFSAAYRAVGLDWLLAPTIRPDIPAIRKMTPPTGLFSSGRWALSLWRIEAVPVGLSCWLKILFSQVLL